MKLLLLPLLLCFLHVGNVLSFGEPVDIDLDDPMVKDVADFALTSFSQELDSTSKMNEVKVNKAQQQVVNGKNYMLEVELMKDGQAVKSCDVVARVTPNMNEKQLTKMDCQQANVEEEDDEEEEDDVSLELNRASIDGAIDIDTNNEEALAAMDVALDEIKVIEGNVDDWDKVELSSAQQQQVAYGVYYYLNLQFEKEGNVSMVCGVTVSVSNDTGDMTVFGTVCIRLGSKRFLGGLSEIDVNTLAVQDAAKFALSTYNQKLDSSSKMNEIRVSKAQSQVVNGMNYLMDVELIKNGKVTKECEVVVWVKPYRNQKEVTRMDCHRA